MGASLLALAKSIYYPSPFHKQRPKRIILIGRLRVSRIVSCTEIASGLQVT